MGGFDRDPFFEARLGLQPSQSAPGQPKAKNSRAELSQKPGSTKKQKGKASAKPAPTTLYPALRTSSGGDPAKSRRAWNLFEHEGDEQIAQGKRVYTEKKNGRRWVSNPGQRAATDCSTVEPCTRNTFQQFFKLFGGFSAFRPSALGRTSNPQDLIFWAPRSVNVGCLWGENQPQRIKAS